MNDLEKQAEKIIKMAKDSGVQSNFLFVTTFDRYRTQLKILEELKTVIEAEGMLVSKEYVRGRENLYTNPAVSEFNRTTDSANKTASTLIRIIKNFNVDDKKAEKDPLLKIINGGADDEF